MVSLKFILSCIDISYGMLAQNTFLGDYEYMVRKVVLEAVNRQLEERPYRVQIEQIHFIHRFQGLPLAKQYKFYPTLSRSYKSLSNFTCVVVGRSEMKMCIRHAVWYCESKECPTVMMSNDVPKCEKCNKNMKECVELRDMSEHVKLSVFPLESVQTPRCMKSIYHKFDVILLDDLTKVDISYGSTYIITGMYDGVKKAFYAWNIVETEEM